MRSRARSRFVAVAAVCGVACVGSSRSPEETGLSDYQRQMKAESIAVNNERDTVYRRRMRDLARRSLLVPTDSLARLYAAIPRTPVADLWRIRQAMGCAEVILISKHGVAAFKKANYRMVDSLIRAGLDVRNADDRSLSAPGPLLSLGVDTCNDNSWLKSTVADSLSNFPERAAVRQR